MNQKKFPPEASSFASETVSLLPLGGIEDVTKNMYLYEYKNEILIIDCGIGFADETMLGVDLLLPDVSYLLNTPKKIIGMLLTHGHEDHIGALPFILPQLPNFPIYSSPFTAYLANEKLKEFEMQPLVKAVSFEGGEIALGNFKASFIRTTHSVPDSANIFLKTPAGNFYHTGDFKFDPTPFDGKRADFLKIGACAREGILALVTDSLGSDRMGYTPSEMPLARNLEREMKDCAGKFVVTTYSSNIARLNQVIQAAENTNRKVCFVGRSLIKAKTVAEKMGYLRSSAGIEVQIEELKGLPDEKTVLIVAGSQGQENSALTRIANNEHKDIKLSEKDTVVFSADPIPGNELSFDELVDSISKNGASVLHSDQAGMFHVSGHGSERDHMLMLSLTSPKFVIPISGNYKHMVSYRDLAEKMGYQKDSVLLLENGQEIVFSRGMAQKGRKIEVKSVYVDQMSGEEVENIVLRDREKLAKEGIVVILAEISESTGHLAESPNIITRGFSQNDSREIEKLLVREVKNSLLNTKGKVKNWVHLRRLLSETSGKAIFRSMRRRPLILPIIIEV